MLRRTLLPGLMVAMTSLATMSSATAAAEEEGQWLQLFNGKNLDGWTVKIKGYASGENFGNTFRVVDGLMTVSYEKYDKFASRFGHIFYQTPYSNYILRVEYRFIGEQCPGGPRWALRNSGVMVHGQTPESMRKDQNFPVSIEVQLLGGTGQGKRTTANLCTPGTHVEMGGKLIKTHCISSKSETYHLDKWVTCEIHVHGGKSIKHVIDGKTVLEYDKPQLDPADRDAKKLIQDGQVILTGGTISLQSESHPVQFRKVELKKLSP